MSGMHTAARSTRRRRIGAALAWLGGGAALLLALRYGAPPLIDLIAHGHTTNILVAVLVGGAVAAADVGALLLVLQGLRQLHAALSSA